MIGQLDLQAGLQRRLQQSRDEPARPRQLKLTGPDAGPQVLNEPRLDQLIDSQLLRVAGSAGTSRLEATSVIVLIVSAPSQGPDPHREPQGVTPRSHTDHLTRSRAAAGWRGFTMTAAGLRLLHDLRRTLLEPPAQLRSRGEPPAADQHGPDQAEQTAQEEVRSA